MLRDCIGHGLTKEATTFWMNHLALALLLLHMTVSKIIGVAPFLLAMARKPLLLSMAIPGLLSPPDQPTPDEEEAYLTEVSRMVEWL